MLPGVTPPIVAKSQSPLSITFLGSVVNSSTTAAISFGNFTPTTPGLMVVSGGGNSSNTTRNVADFSIGGSTGNKVGGATLMGKTIALGARIVSSGAQAVSLIFSSTTQSAQNGVGVWLVTGYTSTVPTDTVFSATTSTAQAINININALGVEVAAAIFPTTANATWSGATEQGAGTTRGSVRFEWAHTTELFTSSTLHATTFNFSGLGGSITVFGAGSWG